MALMVAVDKEVTRSNSITYSSIANDTGQVDHQFSRLKSWIADIKVDSCRYELATILCPLFCHLYLELLCGSHRQSATKFFKRHQALFANRENSRELLEELATISNIQDIETNSYMKVFRSSKYHIKISTLGMTTLQKYLSEHGHVLILQIIQKWFDVEIIHIAKQDKEEEDIGAMKNMKLNIKMEKNIEINNMKPIDKDLEAVREAIRTVKEKPYPSSPLLLYVLSNAWKNLHVTCCRTNERVSLLAAGVGNTVKLWGLGGKLKSVPSSRILLNCPTRIQTSNEDTLSEKSCITLYGHRAPVQDLVFLPRSKTPGVLLSVSQDATMKSSTLDNFKCMATYRGHDNEIWCVDVSSIEIYVATGSRDQTARVWSLERNYPLRTCVGHQSDVECIKFHPNNLYFGTGSADKTVRMWSVNDSKLLRLFCGHRGAVQAISFSPNGKFLASAGEDRRIKIWDIAAGKLLKEYKGHSKSVISLSWSRNNETVSSCSLDGTVRMWNHQRSSEQSESASGDLHQCYTIGSGLLSIQHSKANTLVCIAVT